jgi:hypothetical protein
MKTIIKIAIICVLLIVFACSHQQNKMKEREDAIAKKQFYEELIIKEIDLKGQKELLTKEKIVTKILTTSPRYKQLTKGLYEAVLKNGGLSYGISLEGSPNPKIDKTWMYSVTYDFTLYEMYEERQLNTARFSFDPSNKKLFEKDAVTGKLIPIEFDRKLLMEYNALIK